MFSEMSKSIGHIFNNEQNINNNKSWISQLMYKSFSQGLTMDDIYDCSPSESIETNGKRFDALWQRECHNSNGFRNASLLKVWIDFVKRRVALSTLFYILCLSFGYLSGIVLLRKLLAFIEGPQNSFAVGLFWAFLLAFAEFIRVTCFAIMYAISTQTTVRIGSALHSIIYNKILTTSNICNKRIGEITNLITIDCSKVTHLVNSVPLLVGSPIIIVITFIYSFHLFGVHSIFGALIFVAAVGLQILLANAISKIRKKIITATDDRVSMISETISSIKFVKLCALEGIRNKEAKYLKRCQYLHCINMSLSLMAPITATLITILAHLLFNSKLTAIEAFTLVMLNNIAAQGIRMLPITIRDVIQANISLKRIEKILKQEDECIRQLNFKCSMNAVEFCPNFSSNVNYFNNAPNNINFNFTAVNNKSLSIPHEKLVGVVGNVGCGKTTLLKHMSGEIFSDDVSVNGTIAYLSQQPFLFNDTIRENIVFGLPFNEKKYNEVLHCCGLREDLQSLSDGDCSVVGERALKLSGGQKQRIALSRAVYADRDIYLLDDPLSSLDVNTAQFVFHNCIRQYLRSKTVIMATSQTMFLEHMNSIIYMKDGLLWEYGTHNELLQQSDYSCLISNLCTLGKNNENSTKDVEIENVRSSNSQYSKMCSRRPQMNDTHNKKSDNNDTNQMDSKDVFQIYIKKIGGLNYFIFIVFPFVLFALITNFSQYWLSQWILKLNAVHNQINSNFTNIKLTEFDELKEKQILENYQIIYGVFIILLILSGIISSFLWTSFALKASKRLHNELLSKILESPVRLFEKTETGTMLHLLSKDTEEVDNQVPRTVSAFLNRFLLVIFNVITVIIVYPLFSIAMSAIIVVFVAIYKMFKEALKDLKRIESTLRSNILSHVCNTFRGLVTIKTFNKQKLFIEKFNILCNNYWAAHYLHLCSMRWMYIRLDLLCVLTTLIASMFAISYKNLVGVSFAALAITLSMQLCNNLQVVVRLACDVETRFTAVERICCFIQNSISEKVEKHHLNCNEWPKYGEISFKNVSMKYDNEYSLALKNITFDVNVNEKIGIVGKTAAGKSSLAAALFRLSDCISGTIVIDGFDTSRLPLRTLRPKITIIPQEVTLLSGTIRFNLDPYRQYTDQQLINALEIVSLKNKVFAIPAALEAFVSESENNFSVGEKRLFYVAKALLQKNKIVVLDEPTNCADLITENIIHKIINDMFENATVLIITHNLRTVLNCDRIFVMDNGTITDIDFPENLIQKNFFIEH